MLFYEYEVVTTTCIAAGRAWCAAASKPGAAAASVDSGTLYLVYHTISRYGTIS